LPITVFMAEKIERDASMDGKILIESEIKVVTGLHIGGSSVFSAIGAVDSPVAADPYTHQPIIPGSSLKGKLRSLLARSLSSDGGRHKPENDDPVILRLFGCHSPIVLSRLQFADAFVSNAKDFDQIGLTEIKFENTIDRMTSIANPRQIERVSAGVRFACRIAYTLENPDQIEADFACLVRGMKLLQMDYLGGHGTRGSGRVSFQNIRLKFLDTNLSPETCSRLEALFKDVEEYELFSV